MPPASRSELSAPRPTTPSGVVRLPDTVRTDRPDLVGAIADLSRVATGQFTVTELLVHLVDLAALHLPVDGVGAMVADSQGVRFVHASTTDTDRVERLQELMQQGPCKDSIAQLGEVVVADLREEGRVPDWMSYLSGAEQVGLRAVAALPLVSRGRGWGVLDLYREEPGPWQPWELTVARLLADVAVSYVVMADDRDHARRAQQDLAHRILHDELTGLPNRALLFDRLEHALCAAERHGHTVAVYFIDLDQFKQINDTFGHSTGDRVLVEASTRIASTLRADDTLARLSGDEFVLICEHLPQRTAAELDSQLTAVTDRIGAALAEPIEVGGLHLFVSASIGVALSRSGTSGDDLLSEADAAMYRAKQRRQTQLVVREAPSGVDRRTSRRLDRELARALNESELRVHYQPIVSATDLEVRAVEALLRWEHPVHGLLSAATFIDAAERTGLIAPIGRWLVDEVCAQLRSWHDVLGREAPPAAFVNLSSRELADPGLGETIAAALRRHRLQPRNLGLELLEVSFIDPQLVPLLQDLRNLGHPLSVDDFGTGYSSLSRLIQLPVTTAKIDKAFVAAVEHDPRSRALVDAVLVVASKLDLQVIGEGVETEAQARTLRDAGCSLLQGFHLGVPQPADELTLQWSA